jgi:hypothetical protein
MIDDGIPLAWDSMHRTGEGGIVAGRQAPMLHFKK